MGRFVLCFIGSGDFDQIKDGFDIALWHVP